MIKEIEVFEELSGVNSPLIPRIFSAFKYKTGSDNAWKQVDENGKILSLMSAVDGNFTLISTENTDFDEIREFISFSGFNSVLSDVPIILAGKNSFSLFKYCGNEDIINNNFDYLVLDATSTISQYKNFYPLLFYNEQNDFDSWYCDFSKKIVKNDAKAVALTIDKIFVSIATAPMIYKDTAIVSGVFTSSKLRNKGYSKATIYKLISELKKENITEIYLWCESSLEEFYIKTGFHKVGNVYIETEL